MNRKNRRAEQRMAQIKAAADAKIPPAQKAAAAFGLDGNAVAMDAFSNLAARMGYGTPSLAEGTDYQMVRWTNDYMLMLTLYRNHWIARRIVETPAKDMVRSWPTLLTDLEPKDITLFNQAIIRTGTKSKVKHALTWADLFGGAGALMVLKGQEDILEEPLDLEDVHPGDYQGLIVFDRWSGITPSTEIGTDINRPADFGMPLFYEVRSQDTSNVAFKVHSSRILRFSGPDVPNPEFQASMRWGISRLEIVFEELRKRDNASWSILQLLFRAQILAMQDPELATNMSGGAQNLQGLERFRSRMQAQNELLSNQSMLVMGKDSQLFSHQFGFGGLGEVYSHFEVALAGAADIPFARLFGRTVTGLGQTGDGDELIYAERIATENEERVRPQTDKLFPVVCMSRLGDVPADLDYTFPSITQPTQKEKNEMAKDAGGLIVTVYGAGLLTQRQALMELKALSVSTGVFTNITDEDIAAASDEYSQGDVAEEDEDGEGDDTGEAQDGLPDAAATGTRGDVDQLMEYRSFGRGRDTSTGVAYARGPHDRIVLVRFAEGVVRDATLTFRDGSTMGDADQRPGWKGLLELASAYGD